jgi:hypothetical protein
MTELQPIIDWLQNKAPWLTTAIFVMGAFRIVFKVVSSKIQEYLTKAMQRVVDTEEEDDDLLMEQILRNPFYRVFAFCVDMITSIKLPSTATLQELKRKKI